MRSLLWAVAAAALLATPAAAQAQSGDVSSADLSGAWAFQTQTYGDQRFGVIMSGVAILTPAAPNRYDIRLVSQEMIRELESGRSQTLTARQTCTGEEAGGQLNITCQMAEPLEGYEPDNFVLQRGAADELAGVLSSAASAQVTFARVR